MKVGVPSETFTDESRVALTPHVIQSLQSKGIEVLLEKNAGLKAGFTDAEYIEKGASIIDSRQELYEASDVILSVRSLGANPENAEQDLQLLKKGQTIIGIQDPFNATKILKALKDKGVTTLSMELIPRITRAQSMDVLSSMATVAGYRTVLLAASALPKLFPMMMTAAGAIAPARVFVIGAGVAGLQAIATAKRLGAVVSAYDLRPAVKEQVESLGAKFLEIAIEAGDAEDQGGYAKAMDESFYAKQREMMTAALAENDAIITTAAVPGIKAPLLITREMVEKMSPGSVIVDLAAEQGGNCELTQPGKTIYENHVAIIGPMNIPSSIPYHASQMYAKNLANLLLHITKDGALHLDREDEIVQGTVVILEGEIVHPQVKESMGEN